MARTTVRLLRSRSNNEAGSPPAMSSRQDGCVSGSYWAFLMQPFLRTPYGRLKSPSGLHPLHVTLLLTTLQLSGQPRKKAMVHDGTCKSAGVSSRSQHAEMLVHEHSGPSKLLSSQVYQGIWCICRAWLSCTDHNELSQSNRLCFLLPETIS